MFSSDNIVNERDPDIIKTHVAELLLDIESNMDGSLTFIVDFCVNLMAKTVDSGSPESQQYVQGIITKFGLKFETQEDIIEVCLMVLCILKEPIKQRMDVQILIDAEMVKLVVAFLDLEKSNTP